MACWLPDASRSSWRRDAPAVDEYLPPDAVEAVFTTIMLFSRSLQRG